MPSPFGRLGGQLPRPSAGNEILETHRLVGHGQFEHAIKHHAAAAGAAAIEAEHELVEVVAHVGTVGGPPQPFEVVQAVRIGSKPGLKLANRARVVLASARIRHALNIW